MHIGAGALGGVWRRRCGGLGVGEGRVRTEGRPVEAADWGREQLSLSLSLLARALSRARALALALALALSLSSPSLLTSLSSRPRFLCTLFYLSIGVPVHADARVSPNWGMHALWRARGLVDVPHLWLHGLCVYFCILYF